MDRKISFIEELKNQLKQYQIEKINLAEQKLQTHLPRLNQKLAKQTLIDLGDFNESSVAQQNGTSICRWNNKKDAQVSQQNSIIVKRNNLMTERYHHSQAKLQSLRTYSTKQIPQLKQLLEKLSTPTNKKRKTIDQRSALTSARRNKNNFQSQQKILSQKYSNISQEDLNQVKGTISERKSTLKGGRITQRKDTENKNPILYPINESIKQKSRNKQYQKINRKNLHNWNLLNNPNANQIVHQKQLLQSLIKNTITSQSSRTNSQQNVLNLLGQYSNLNYFSSNFRNQEKKKGTLTNLLI